MARHALGGQNLILAHDLKLGKILSMQFGVDDNVAMRVTIAGSSASVKVWDLRTSLVASPGVRCRWTVEEVCGGQESCLGTRSRE